MNSLSKIILISGPTASGKSSLAIKLAKKINGEIINADSMQVYKQFKILTARPKKKEQKNIAHYLYGYINFNKKYSTGHWLKDAIKKIKMIKKNNKIPIIVGGTGLYFHSLINGLVKIPNIPTKIRNEIRLKQKKEGQKIFYKNLLKLDPKVKNKLDSNDSHRSIRAFEVKYYTKISLYEWIDDTQSVFKEDDFIKFNISSDRKNLIEKIEKRTHQMIREGALKEVKKLNNLKIKKESSINKIIGIFELNKYLNKEISLDKAKELMSIKTRQYAKRQATWARGKMSSWISIEPHNIESIVKRVNI